MSHRHYVGSFRCFQNPRPLSFPQDDLIDDLARLPNLRPGLNVTRHSHTGLAWSAWGAFLCGPLPSHYVWATAYGTFPFALPRSTH